MTVSSKPAAYRVYYMPMVLLIADACLVFLLKIAQTGVIELRSVIIMLACVWVLTFRRSNNVRWALFDDNMMFLRSSAPCAACNSPTQYFQNGCERFSVEPVRRYAYKYIKESGFSEERNLFAKYKYLYLYTRI